VCGQSLSAVTWRETDERSDKIADVIVFYSTRTIRNSSTSALSNRRNNSLRRSATQSIHVLTPFSPEPPLPMFGTNLGSIINLLVTFNLEAPGISRTELLFAKNAPTTCGMSLDSLF
jgi:hypothetical protein